MRLSYTRYLLAAAMLATLALPAGCRRVPPVQPGEMVLFGAMNAKVRTLDPGDIGDVTSASVAALIFECLFEYHYLRRPYELQPMLAEAMPEVSADGLVYTIRIRRGVYFADDRSFPGGVGRELTAHDFVYSWKRIANVKNRSVNWWIFEGRIIGLDDFRRYTETAEVVDYSRPVEGLYAADDHTLVIRLTKPWPQIVYMLAHLPTAAVAREAVDYYGDRIINHPVGTGPFVLRTWRRGSYIELVRNPNFREVFYPSDGEPGDREKGLLDDAGKRLPLADRILMVVVEEDQPRWFLFMRGKIDISGIPKDNFSEAISGRGTLTEQMQKLGITLTSFRAPSTFWIGFNMEDPLLGNNKPLRQAISYAIDRQKFIDMFTNSRADLAAGFIPPMMTTYDPNIKDMPATSYNLEEARRLVAEAERLHGGKLPRLTLAMPGTDTVARQQGGFLVDQFRAAGLDVEIDYMDWPTYQGKIKTKSAQMFMSGWLADYFDSENFLQLFYSRNASPGPNSFNYSNPEYDALFERLAVMPDTPERDILYRKAERMVVADTPAAFIMHGVAYVLKHDWVYNYKPSIFNPRISMFRRVDPEQRSAFPELRRTIRRTSR
ncbi:MAG TPA: ABC transporter substrate-binding protein [Sedimentisphaerales bacterium]|nr:ABC transporter substrate-binding protein [Sedimentisphaerales bacterium]